MIARPSPPPARFNAAAHLLAANLQRPEKTAYIDELPQSSSRTTNGVQRSPKISAPRATVQNCP